MQAHASIPIPSTALREGLLVGGAGMVIAALVLAAPPLFALAAVFGLLGLVAVLRYPFVGLYVIVLSSQLGGLIEWLFGSLEDVFLEGVALTTFAGVALNAYREPRDRRLGPNVVGFRCALLYALVLLVSYLMADNQPGAETAVLKRLMLVVLLYLILLLVRTRGQHRRLVVAIALGTAISGAVSLVSDRSGTPLLQTDDADVEDDGTERQVGASSSNATTTSQMMLAGTGIAAILALRLPHQRRIFLLLALAGVVGIVLANARSSFLVGSFGLAWLLFKQRRHRRLPAILICAFLIGCMALPLIPEWQAERFATLFSPGEDYTLGRRWGYQVIGLDLLASNPFLGIGVGNYAYLYMGFEYRWIPGRSLLTRELHNMYLSVAVQSGLLGLACFAGMLGAALHSLVRVQREQAPGSESAVYAEALHFGYVLFLLACLVAPATTNKLTWVLTGLALVLPVTTRAAAEDSHDPLSDGGTLTAAIAPFVK